MICSAGTFCGEKCPCWRSTIGNGRLRNAIEQHQDDGYGHLIPGGLTRKSASIAKLPIIDFEPFLEGSASGKRSRAKPESACVDVGFFYLANHGVPSRSSTAPSRRAGLFALPLAEKMEISSARRRAIRVHADGSRRG
jgi:hypothetical protein